MAGNEWWIIKIIDNRKVSALGTLNIPSDFYSRLQFIYVVFFLLFIQLYFIYNTETMVGRCIMLI